MNKRKRKKRARKFLAWLVEEHCRIIINGLVDAGLISPGAVDGDRRSGDLVGWRVRGAEQIISPALGVERAHTYTVNFGAPIVDELGGATKEEGAGEDE